MSLCNWTAVGQTMNELMNENLYSALKSLQMYAYLPRLSEN